MPSGRRTNKNNLRSQINEFNCYTAPGSNCVAVSNPRRSSDMDLQDNTGDNRIHQYSSQQYSVIGNPVTYLQQVGPPDSGYNVQSSSSRVPVQNNIQQHSVLVDVRDDSREFMEAYLEDQYQDDDYNFDSSNFNLDDDQQRINTTQELHIGMDEQDERYPSCQMQMPSQRSCYRLQQPMESIIQQMSNQSISQTHHNEQQSQRSIMSHPSISQQQSQNPQCSFVSSTMRTQPQIQILRHQKRSTQRQMSHQQQQFIVNQQDSSMNPSIRNRIQQQKNEQQIRFSQMHLHARMSSPIRSRYSPIHKQNQMSTPPIQQPGQGSRGFAYPGDSPTFCPPAEPGPSRDVPVSHPSQYVYINYNQNPQIGYMYENSLSNSSLNPPSHHQSSSIQSSHTQPSPTSPFCLMTSPIQRTAHSEEGANFVSPRIAPSSVEWQRMIERRNVTRARTPMDGQSRQQISIHQSPNYGQQYQMTHLLQIQGESMDQTSIECLLPLQGTIQQGLQSRTVAPIPVLSPKAVDQTFEQIQIQQSTHQIIEAEICDPLEQLINDEIDQRVQRLHAQDAQRNKLQQGTSIIPVAPTSEASTPVPSTDDPYEIHRFSSSEESSTPSIIPQSALELQDVNIPLAPMRRTLWSSSSSSSEDERSSKQKTSLSSQEPKQKEPDDEKSSNKSSRKKKGKYKSVEIIESSESSDSEPEKKESVKKDFVKIVKEKKKKSVTSSDEDRRNKKELKKASRIRKDYEKNKNLDIPKVKSSRPKDYKADEGNLRRYKDKPSSNKKKKDRSKSNDFYKKLPVIPRPPVKDYTQPRPLSKSIERSRPVPHQKPTTLKVSSALLREREAAERLAVTARPVYPSCSSMARHGMMKDYTILRNPDKEAQRVAATVLKAKSSQSRPEPKSFTPTQCSSLPNSTLKSFSRSSSLSLVSSSKKTDVQSSSNKKPDPNPETTKSTQLNLPSVARNSCGLPLEDIIGDMVFPSTPFEEIKKVMKAREAVDRAKLVKSTETANKEQKKSDFARVGEDQEVQKSDPMSSEEIQIADVSSNKGLISIKKDISSSIEFNPGISPVEKIQDSEFFQSSSTTKTSEKDLSSLNVSIFKPDTPEIISKDVPENKNESIKKTYLIHADPAGLSTNSPIRRRSDDFLFEPPVKRPCPLTGNAELNIFAEDDPFGFIPSETQADGITLSEFMALAAESDATAEIIPFNISYQSDTNSEDNIQKSASDASNDGKETATVPKNYHCGLGSSNCRPSSQTNQINDSETTSDKLFRDSREMKKSNVLYEQKFEKLVRFYETAEAYVDGDKSKEAYVGIASLSDFLQLTKTAVRWLQVGLIPVLPFEDTVDEFREGSPRKAPCEIPPKPCRMFANSEPSTGGIQETVYGYSKFSRLELSVLLGCYFIFEEINENPTISTNIAKLKFHTTKWCTALRKRMEKNEHVHPLFVIWASATCQIDRPLILIEFTQIIFKNEFRELKEAKEKLGSKIFQKKAYDVFIRKAEDMSGDPDTRELPFIIAAGRMMNQMFQIRNPSDACSIAKRLSYCLLEFRNSQDKKIKAYRLRKKDEDFWSSFFEGLHSTENIPNKSELLKLNGLLNQNFLNKKEEKSLIIQFFHFIIGRIFPGITPLDVEDDPVLYSNGYVSYVIYLSNEVLKAWMQYHEFKERMKSSTDLTVLEEKFVFYDDLNPVTFRSNSQLENWKFFEVLFPREIDAALSHLELEQLDNIMEILQVVSDKENGSGKKKQENENNSEQPEDQRRTSQVPREIYNSYVAKKTVSKYSVLTRFNLSQKEITQKLTTSKGLLSLTPEVPPKPPSNSKKILKFFKNRKSKEEIPLCAVCDGKQTIIYNTPLPEMESFVDSIKKKKNLENTALLVSIWTKTRELNRDWALSGRVTYQHVWTLEDVFDINNNEEIEESESRKDKLLDVIGTIIPYDIRKIHWLMKLCRYYFHSSCFDTVKQKFGFFLEEAVGNPFAT